MRKLNHGFSTIIIVIIGLVVVGGIGLFVASRGNTPTSESLKTNSDTSEVSQKEAQGEIEGSFDKLLSSGQNVECEFRMPTVSGENPFGNGKFWTIGKKGRSQMKGEINGMVMESNAIYKDDVVYTWFDTAGIKKGFKFDKDDMKMDSKELTPQEREQAEQYSRDMKFNCRPWTPDESKFELPTDINFD